MRGGCIATHTLVERARPGITCIAKEVRRVPGKVPFLAHTKALLLDG